MRVVPHEAKHVMSNKTLKEHVDQDEHLPRKRQKKSQQVLQSQQVSTRLPGHAGQARGGGEGYARHAGHAGHARCAGHAGLAGQLGKQSLQGMPLGETLLNSHASSNTQLQSCSV